MAEKQTNRQVGSLEKAIRQDAEKTARIEFYHKFKALYDNAHSGTWTKEFTYEDWKDLERLTDKYVAFIAVPTAEEKAIKTFLGTYEKLAIEFPTMLQEIRDGAYEDGKHDGRNENG